MTRPLSPFPDTVQTLVVGAGVSGMAMIAELRRRDPATDMLCVDRTDALGGIWRPNATRPGTGGAYTSLHLNTAARTSAFRDMPMPATYPRYPSHAQVGDYLRAYADQHHLTDAIRTGVAVARARPSRRGQHGWKVTLASDAGHHMITCENLVIAGGLHDHPNLPDPIPGQRQFGGRLLHTVDYQDALEFRDRRVVVVGMGNSAADIAVDLSRIAKRTVLSVRRGMHVIPKMLFGMTIDDIASSKWWARTPARLQRAIISAALQLTRGHVTNYGLPAPGHRLFDAPVTISDDLITRLSHGDITVRPAIVSFDRDNIVFADGSHEPADAVIYCTGYRIDYPYLPTAAVFGGPTGQVQLYRRVVAPYHPGLYLIGVIRPVGPVMPVVQGQAAWVADLIDGTATLPSTDVMADEITAHLARMTARHSPSRTDSIHVNIGGYLKQLAAERAAGARRARQTHPHAVPMGLAETNAIDHTTH